MSSISSIISRQLDQNRTLHDPVRAIESLITDPLPPCPGTPHYRTRLKFLLKEEISLMSARGIPLKGDLFEKICNRYRHNHIPYNDYLLLQIFLEKMASDPSFIEKETVFPHLHGFLNYVPAHLLPTLLDIFKLHREPFSPGYLALMLTGLSESDVNALVQDITEGNLIIADRVVSLPGGIITYKGVDAFLLHSINLSPQFFSSLLALMNGRTLEEWNKLLLYAMISQEIQTEKSRSAQVKILALVSAQMNVQFPSLSADFQLAILWQALEKFPESIDALISNLYSNTPKEKMLWEMGCIWVHEGTQENFPAVLSTLTKYRSRIDPERTDPTFWETFKFCVFNRLEAESKTHLKEFCGMAIDAKAAEERLPEELAP